MVSLVSKSLPHWRRVSNFLSGENDVSFLVKGPVCATSRKCSPVSANSQQPSLARIILRDVQSQDPHKTSASHPTTFHLQSWLHYKGFLTQLHGRASCNI